MDHSRTSIKQKEKHKNKTEHQRSRVAHPLHNLYGTGRCSITLSHSVSTGFQCCNLQGCRATLFKMRMRGCRTSFSREGGSVAGKSALVQWRATLEHHCYTAPRRATLGHLAKRQQDEERLPTKNRWNKSGEEVDQRGKNQRGGSKRKILVVLNAPCCIFEGYMIIEKEVDV